MKKRDKLLTGVVTVMSALTLAACSSSTSQNSKIVTMKGDDITVSDFYKQAKETTAGRQVMLTLVLNRVFEKEYGDKISDKDVTKAYNQQVDAYGSNFSAALTSAGLTEATYKQQIRLEKMIEYAVEKAASKELTDANYKKAYDSYNPEISIQAIKLKEEDKAKSTLEKAKANGADFAKIAKDNTVADKVDYKFDSAETVLPSDVQAAAFKLNEGQVSDVITSMDTTTYQPMYYIIKVTKKEKKNSDWKTYQKRLKKIILDSKKSDSNFQNQVIAETLKKANVKIKEHSFSNILSNFNLSNSDKTTSNSSSSSSKSTEKSSSTTDSSKK